MERKQWLATRRTGIGGTDAAAILGLSPWKTAMDVWMDKRGLAEDREDNFFLELGRLMEPVITDLYERESKRRTEPGILVRHKKAPLLLGTPDRLCLDEPRGVELKTENQFTDNFGEPGTDQIPDHYLIQVAHYMAITERPLWDVAVLHGGFRFSIYTVHRDLELEEQMIMRLLEWWENHIVRGVPPDVDSSNAWRSYLHKKYPLEMLPMMPLAPENEYLVTRLAEIHRAQGLAEAIRTELENKLKSIIGDHEGIHLPDGKITWRKTKDSKHVDWEGAYHAIRLEAYNLIDRRGPEFHEAAESFLKLAEMCLNISTTTRPGVRRFLFTPGKRETNARDNVIDLTSTIAPSAPAILGNGGEHASGSSESGDRSSLHHGGKTST